MSIKTKSIFGVFIFLAAFAWLVASSFPDKNFHLIACNVGQGDAILAVYGKTQILIDGGPDRKVLDCLGSHLPFWDREIEMVVLTHPQKDHFDGLIEVFNRYKVDNFLANSLDASSVDYQVLKNAVGGSGAQVINPTTGMEMRLGLIYLDIVWPNEQLIASENSNKIADSTSGVLGAFTSKRDPNEFSIITVLRLGNFNALLTGDIQPPMIDDVETEMQAMGVDDVDYIKIPHHGSKNGLTEDLLRFAKPEVAVISVGKDNSYGHPSAETLDLLAKYKVKVLRTDEVGDVEVVSDGENYWMQN